MKPHLAVGTTAATECERATGTPCTLCNPWFDPGIPTTEDTERTDPRRPPNSRRVGTRASTTFIRFLQSVEPDAPSGCGCPPADEVASGRRDDGRYRMRARHRHSVHSVQSVVQSPNSDHGRHGTHRSEASAELKARGGHAPPPLSFCNRWSPAHPCLWSKEGGGVGLHHFAITPQFCAKGVAAARPPCEPPAFQPARARSDRPPTSRRSASRAEMAAPRRRCCGSG